MGFALLSKWPDYANIIEPFIALAPVAFVDNALTPFKKLSFFTPIVEKLSYRVAGDYLFRQLLPSFCSPKFIRTKVCANLMYLVNGFNKGEMKIERLKTIISNFGDTSFKNLAHYGQGINSKRFAHYDHGPKGNLKRYGNVVNPDYDLGRIRSNSIALISSDNDWLGSPKDVERLKQALTVEPHYVYNVTEVSPKWNHMDFVYGRHCGPIVNIPIANILNKFRDE